MKTAFQIAWKTIKEKRHRAFLLVVSTAVSAFLLFTSYFFINSFQSSMEAVSGRLGADLILVPKGMGSYVADNVLDGTHSPFYFDEKETINKLNDIEDITEIAPQLFIHTISTSCCGTDGDFPIVAFDPDRDFTLAAFMAGSQQIEKKEVVIGINAGGDRFIYHYGDEAIKEKVMLFFENFRVKNVLFPTGTGADETIFMRLDTARELIPNIKELKHIPSDAVSAIFINTTPFTKEFVKQQLEIELDNVDVVIGSGLKEQLNRQILPLKILSYTMIVVALLLTLLQVATLFSALIRERQKEIGMLFALGVYKHRVYRLLLAEATIVAFMGSTIGVIFSLALLYDRQTLLFMLFQLPLVFPDLTKTAIISVVTVSVITIASIGAAFWPIRSFFAREPYEVVREGEG